EDATPPVIVASGTPLTLGCNPSPADINAALGSATYTDNCGPTTATALTGVDGSVTSTGCARSQTRTWNLSDACGNPATTVSRTVTWTVDTKGPTIACPKDFFMVQSSGACDPPDPSISGQATATDDCSEVGSIKITYSDVISGTCPKSIQRTWTAKDACGNSSTSVQKITCFCTPSLVTDTARCTLPATCGSAPGFMLIFTQDPLTMS